MPLADLPSSPWKNGGGSTRTLAVEPPDATLDTFLWRVSLADVNEAGAFSQFPGVDRTIMLWSGDGLDLRSSSWSHSLSHPYQPFLFRGEDDIHCSLLGGPTVDLNIMFRRGSAQATVRIAREPLTITEPVETIFVLCAAGGLKLLIDGHERTVLGPDQFVRVAGSKSPITLTPSSPDTIFVTLSIHCHLP